MIIRLVGAVNDLLWGDLIILEFSGGDIQFGLSLLVLILIPAGLYFTFKTRFLPFRLFPEMIRVTLEKDETKKDENSISGVQALIVATATRVGMGNLAGVVAAISFGGAGAVFWMWLRPHSLALPAVLSNPRWHKSTKKRILSTAVIAAVRLT